MTTMGERKSARRIGAVSRPDGEPGPEATFSRRRFVLAGGAVLLGACTGDGSAPAASTVPDEGPRASSAGETSIAEPGASDDAGLAPAGGLGLTATQFESITTCVLLPELASGPFPLDQQFDRSDITEGYPGQSLRLGLRVVDADCLPVPGAAVEVWHADASGDYSAFEDNGGGKDEGPGTTFLRGTQRADPAGIVEFQTIFPGWYPGRAVHIHVRVHIDGVGVLTSQLFFPDEVTSATLAQAPYAEFGPPDTTNTTDRLAGDVAVDGTLLTTMATETVDGRATLALANLGMRRPAS